MFALKVITSKEFIFLQESSNSKSFGLIHSCRFYRRGFQGYHHFITFVSFFTLFVYNKQTAIASLTVSIRIRKDTHVYRTCFFNIYVKNLSEVVGAHLHCFY